MIMRTSGTRRLAVVAGPLLFLAGCGDDEDGGVQAYCELTRAIDQPAELVEDEMLDALIDAAPAEIADDVEFLALHLRRADLDEIDRVFADPAVAAHIEPVERFERRYCGIVAGDDGGPHTHQTDTARRRSG